MLNQIFDFEKVLVQKIKADTRQFTTSGAYQYLTACLIDRRNILDELETYPHMRNHFP